MVRRKLLLVLLSVFFLSFAVALSLMSVSALSIDMTYPVHGDNYNSKINRINWISNGVTGTSVCWYDVGDAVNHPINCSLGTMEVSPSNENTNTWTIYINDTTEQHSDFSTFWVDSIAPVITVTNPVSNISYLSQTFFQLVFHLDELNKYYFVVGKPLLLKICDPGEDIDGACTIDNIKLTINSSNHAYYKHTPAEDLSDGEYNYRVSANDTMGHFISKEGKVVLDNIQPSVSITSPTNNQLSSGIVAITSTATDERSGINSILVNVSQNALSHSLTCSSSPCIFNWNSTEFIDGLVNITPIAVDQAGNSNSTQVTFEIDNNAPVITFNSPNAGAYNSNQVVSITATDNHLSQVYLYVNSQLRNSTSQSTITYLLGEGNWTVYATAIDSLGNDNQANVSRNIIVDTTPPTTSVSSSDSTWYNPSVDVTLTCEDGVGVGCSVILYCTGVECTPNTVYSSPFTISALGTTQISFASNDSLGNQEVTKTTFVKVDSSAPNAQISSPLAGDYLAGSVLLSANVQDSLSGVERVEFWHSSIIETLIGNGTFNSGSGKYELSWDTHEVVDGSHALWINAYDNVANLNRTDSILINVDNSAPEITITASPADNSALAYDFSSERFEIDVSDIGVGINSSKNCTLRVGNYSSNAWIFYSLSSSSSSGFSNVFINLDASDLDGNGSYIWNITCVDNLGNSNTTENKRFTVLVANSEASEFTNSTDLTTESNISNVLYFFVGNSFGSVNFTESIDFSSGFDWSPFINISNNRIEVDSANEPRLNKSAIITLYNINWTIPKIFVNGVACESPKCINLSYSGGTYVFSVTGFSTYTTEEGYVAPASSSGSGGGSSSSSCITNWTCTLWTACNSGTQTRTCSKINEDCYVSEASKPVESQTCFVSNSSNIENSGSDEGSSGSGITGAVIGSKGVRNIIIGLVFIGVIAGAYLFIRARKLKGYSNDNIKMIRSSE